MEATVVEKQKTLQNVSCEKVDRITTSMPVVPEISTAELTVQCTETQVPVAEHANDPEMRTATNGSDGSDASGHSMVLHNMVATHEPAFKCKDYMTAIERYLDESDHHELNEQAEKGRTALHVSVEYGNVEAIAGLLMCGADVNVVDNNGKSPFTYCLEGYDMRKEKCNQMFYTFLGHVHKLVVIGLHVNEENKRCYKKARARHVFNDKQLQLSYAIELDKMEDVMVSKRTTLRQVLYQGADEIATSTMKRQTFEEILTASDFYKEFPKLCCLLKLQYRRGLTRRKLMQSIKMSLEELAGIGLPDPCSEAIIRHLNDDDLTKLMLIRT